MFWYIPLFRCLASILVFLKHIRWDMGDFMFGYIHYLIIRFLWKRKESQSYLVSPHQLQPELGFCKVLVSRSSSAPNVADPLTHWPKEKFNGKIGKVVRLIFKQQYQSTLMNSSMRKAAITPGDCNTPVIPFFHHSFYEPVWGVEDLMTLWHYWEEKSK